MAISPETATALAAEQAEEYLFVLNALRWCLPRADIVDWHAYKWGDISRSATNPKIENVRPVVGCVLGDGDVDTKELSYFFDEVGPVLDPLAAAIIRASAVDSPIVRHSVA